MSHWRLLAVGLCTLCLLALPWRGGYTLAAPPNGSHTVFLPLTLRIPAVPYPAGIMGLVATDIGGDDDVFVVSGEGVIQTTLTTDTLDSIDPTWSPDAAYVVYHEQAGVTDTLTDRLVIQQSNGSDRRLLQDLSGRESTLWSPDSAWLLVLSNLGGGNIPYSLYLTDGSATQPLTPIFQNDRVAHFGWAPDSSAFFYTRDIYVNGVYDTRLYVYTPATGDVVTVATGLFLQQDEMPVWSPDSRALAYNARVGIEVHVFVVARDGTGRTEISPATVNDSLVGWVGADRLLLATRLTSGAKQLVLARDDGTDRTPLSNPAENVVAARLVPTTDNVLYQTGGSTPRLYLQATDAATPTLLLQAPTAQTVIEFDAVQVVAAEGFAVIPTKRPLFQPPPNDNEYLVYRADFSGTAATTQLVTTGLVGVQILPDTDYMIGYSAAPYGRPQLYHFPTGRRIYAPFPFNGGVFRFYEWRSAPPEPVAP